MTNPTEERLWDWIDGVIAHRPYRAPKFTNELALFSYGVEPEHFANLLPLLRLYYRKHPEYSYQSEQRSNIG